MRLGLGITRRRCSSSHADQRIDWLLSHAMVDVYRVVDIMKKLLGWHRELSSEQLKNLLKVRKEKAKRDCFPNPRFVKSIGMCACSILLRSLQYSLYFASWTTIGSLSHNVLLQCCQHLRSSRNSFHRNLHRRKKTTSSLIMRCFAQAVGSLTRIW